MSSAKTNTKLPLIDCGLSNDELIHAIALRYQQAMHTKSPTQPDAIHDFHLNFARNIVSRSFDGLEFICNGLNSTGKAIFCEVTGQALPKAQGASRSALRDWCGVSELDDQLQEAHRNVAVWLRAAERELGHQMAGIVTSIAGWYNRGLVEIVKINSKHYVANRAGTGGIDLSARGAQCAKYRRYLEAFLDLQALRVKKGEIVEPAYVPPLPVTPAPVAQEPQMVTQHAQSHVAPVQHGFDF